MERLLTPAQAARVLNVSTRTLQRWRASGTGPHFVKMNQVVRYDEADLAAWVVKKRR